jgi:hypothetical protein
MSPEDFFEQMKIVFSQWEGAETMNTSNTSNTPQNIIAKPRKNYINVHDILSTFNINKDIYNNLLSVGPAGLMLAQRRIIGSDIRAAVDSRR